MGVDCRLNMPDSARINAVADAIGIALGCPFTWSKIPSVDVRGVRVEASSVAGMAAIKIKTPTGEGRYFNYHFEGDNGGRTMLFRCTAANIALAVRIAETFGGTVDFNDCDDSSVDFKAKEFKFNAATDGKPWRALQNHIAAVTPITPSFIATFEKFDAYKEV